MLGQKVKTLAEGSKNAGIHTLQWNGLDDAGQMHLLVFIFIN